MLLPVMAASVFWMPHKMLARLCASFADPILFGCLSYLTISMAANCLRFVGEDKCEGEGEQEKLSASPRKAGVCRLSLGLEVVRTVSRARKSLVLLAKETMMRFRRQGGREG